MLKQERQELILSEITANNKVHSSDLSFKLNVSEDTIRRDLKELADQGYLKKVHGGAMANPVGPQTEKNQAVSYEDGHLTIAQKCLPLIRESQVILIEGYESAVALADLLPTDFDLTIVTNSLPVASRLLPMPHIKVFLLGGELASINQCTMGPEVTQALSQIRAKLCFMELPGIHSEIGITETDRAYAMTKKAMIKAAATVVGTALSRDIGSVKPFVAGSPTTLAKLVTELHQPIPHLQSFYEKGIEVI